MERIIQAHGLLSILHWLFFIAALGYFAMNPEPQDPRAQINATLIFILLPVVVSALICTYALYRNWRYHLKVGFFSAVLVALLYWGSLYFTNPSMTIKERIEYQKYLMFIPWLYTLILFASVFIIGFFMPKTAALD